MDAAIPEASGLRAGWSGISLVPENLEAFALRVRSARAATTSLDLLYYAWHEDATGRALMREVLHAADRGVRVRLLLDDLYVREAERGLAALDAHPRIEVRLFNPFRLRRCGALGQAAEFLVARYRLNHRMHNKAWIADGSLAIGGGRNIGDEYFDASSQFNFRDLDLVMTGGAVAGAAAAFERYWASTRVRPLAEVAAAAGDGLDALRARLDEAADDILDPGYRQRLAALPALDDLVHAGRVAVPDGAIRVVADPPEKGRLRRRLPGVLDAIAAAMEGAAAGPDHFPLLRAGAARGAPAGRAGAPGVRVSVLTNSLAATDVLAVHGGYARYRRPLLRAGIAMHELKQGGQEGGSLLGSGSASLHTKALVVDDDLVFVGSFNLDPRSAYLNTEMGAFVRHPTPAAELAEEFARLTDPARSWSVRLAGPGLVWQDGERELRHEPGASLGRRVLARILGWLPIETHL
ncbi:phospholipase D family protein [Roseomonas sp. CCTCC AB2023176]|uniref:phospholipase D family protein n=1 Tax=Roseomonas sp. CCTCC AB2023176 TaxID=3342640 RepID=UPI0035E2E09E